jgi:acylphosphatase
MTDATIRKRAIVSGQVQGVFFRKSTVDQATAIGGITGWVQNLPDGRVEVLLEGGRNKVEPLVAWLHQGPAAATVTGVELFDETPTGEFSTFTVTWADR